MLAKYGGGILPVILVGEVISLSSNSLLRSSSFVMTSGALTTIVIALTVSAMAVGFGARMPDFKAENLAKVASGFGGVVYMADALAYIGVVVLLEAYPTYRIYDATIYDYPLSRGQLAACAGCYSAVVVVSAITAFTALRDGANALEAREYA